VKLDTHKTNLVLSIFSKKQKYTKTTTKKQEYITPRLGQTQNYLKIAYLGGR